MYNGAISFSGSKVVSGNNTAESAHVQSSTGYFKMSNLITLNNPRGVSKEMARGGRGGRGWQGPSPPPVVGLHYSTAGVLTLNTSGSERCQSLFEL